MIQLKERDWIKSFNYSFSALCCQSLFVIPYSSIIMLIVSNENLYYNVIYNIFMSASVFLFSIIMYKNDIIKKISPRNKDNTIINLIYNALFLIFANHVLGFLFLRLEKKLFYFTVLLIIIFDSLTKLSIMMMNKKDSDLMTKDFRLRMLKDKSDILKNKHTEILKIKGFTRDLTNGIYNHLEKQDIKGLMSYISEKVYPLYLLFRSDASNIRDIDQIKDPFIKEIITDFCHRISKKKDIKITFSILYNTMISEENQLETYECIQSILHNNYNELVNCDRNGEKILHIHISNSYNKFTFFTYCSSNPQNKQISEVSIRRNWIRKLFQKRAQNIDLRILRDCVFFCQQIEVKQ